MSPRVKQEYFRDHFAMPAIVKSMGLVFGDIGTSPIYTFTAIFFLIPPRPEYHGYPVPDFLDSHAPCYGQYTSLAMRLGKKGEGGSDPI